MKVVEVQKYLIELNMITTGLEELAVSFKVLNDPVIAMTKETGCQGWSVRDRNALLLIDARVDILTEILRGK